MRGEHRYAIGNLPASCFDDRTFWTEVWERWARKDGFEPTGQPSATLVPESGMVRVEGPVRKR